MTWLWIILIAAVIGGIIGFMMSGRKKEATEGATTGKFNYGFIILKILLALIGLYLLLVIGKWLFRFYV